MFTNLKEKLIGALKSWTMWFNGLALTIIYALPDIVVAMPEHMASLAPYISAEHYQRIMFWVLIVNMVLRAKTNSSLRDKA